VPRTRPQVDREQKIDDILEVAETMVRQRGLAALSVAGVARQLGIAGNAVYWYFPTRDHLVVAVVERLGHRAFEAKPKGKAWNEQLLALVDQFSELYPHASALHERALHSDVVAEFERSLYERLQAMLAAVLSGHLPAGDDPDEAASLFMATVLGCFARATPARERRRLLQRLLSQLVPDLS
jgi:AcrR family transcriptional regulator